MSTCDRERLQASIEGMTARWEQHRLLVQREHGDVVAKRAAKFEISRGPEFFWSVPTWRAGRKLMSTSQIAVYGASYEVVSRQGQRDRVAIAANTPEPKNGSLSGVFPVLLLLPEDCWSATTYRLTPEHRAGAISSISASVFGDDHGPMRGRFAERIASDFRRFGGEPNARSKGTPIFLNGISWDKPAKPGMEMALGLASVFMSESPKLGVSPKNLIRGLLSEVTHWSIAWQKASGLHRSDA